MGLSTGKIDAIGGGEYEKEKHMFLVHNRHTQKFACYLKKENNELRLLD